MLDRGWIEAAPEGRKANCFPGPSEGAPPVGVEGSK